jgi:hypothetical protein
MTRIRRLRASLPLLVLSLLTLFGPSAQAQFHVLPGEVLETVPVIALLPTAMPADVEGAESAGAKIDMELAKALTKAGFKVVGADVYKSIETEFSTAAGGFYDPFTGAVKKEVASAVFKQAMPALLERHNANGFAFAGLVQRRVPFKDTKKVTWDGVVEDVIAKQGLFAALDHSLGIRRDEGVIPTVSLIVQVFDDRGRVVFESAGGIAATAAVANRDFVAVDLSAVLNDSGRLQRAAEVLVWPMTHKGTAEVMRQYSGDSKSTFRTTLPIAAKEVLPTSAPAAQIKEKVMTVALARIDAAEHPQPERVQALYEKQLIEALVKAGFRVLPSATYAQAFDASAHEVGGIYDVITGKVVPEKSKAMDAALKRRLREEHAVDAVLTPRIELVTATYDQKGDARWDGVTQSVFKTEYGWNGKAYSGQQPALSLGVRLEDMNAQHLYSSRAGVELTALFISGGFERLPREELLLDQTKSSRAVELALAGMTGGGATALGGN